MNFKKHQMAKCLKEIHLKTLLDCNVIEEEEIIHDQVVPLSNMVRESYLRYLKQIITTNLNTCSDTNVIYIQHDIERCAGLLELKALRLCMVTSLYQKAMLKIVADIKHHTKESKLYDKFEKILSQDCICKVSEFKSTQTNLSDINAQDSPNIHEENVNHVDIKSDFFGNVANSLDSTNLHSIINESRVSVDLSAFSTPVNKYHDSNHHELKNYETVDNSNGCSVHIKDYRTFNINNDNEDLDKIPANAFADNESLEITRVCMASIGASPERASKPQFPSFKANANDDETINQLTSFLNDNNSKSGFGEALLYETATQELIRILESEGELTDEDVCNKKQNKIGSQILTNKADSFWKSQRLLQKQRLHDRIARICCNPEAKVKMKNKFFNIFGFDSDEDEVWCSKEKIAHYKQSIAPCVVRHLLPYYKQKRILNRNVFKHVASHITDKLVSFKHFPEETDVERCIVLFFSYHGFIGKPDDIWSEWDRNLC